jgi:hypothetical protein
VGSGVCRPGVPVGDKGAESCEGPSGEKRWADQDAPSCCAHPIYVGQMVDREWPGVYRGAS